MQRKISCDSYLKCAGKSQIEDAIEAFIRSFPAHELVEQLSTSPSIKVGRWRARTKEVF